MSLTPMVPMTTPPPGPDDRGDVQASRTRAFVLGAVATLAGAGLSELGSGLAHARLSPVLAIGEAVIEITPGSVAEAAISAVGRYDKPLLVLGVVVAMVVLGGLAGVLLLRSRTLALAAYVVLGAVAAAAVWSESDNRQVDVALVVIGAAVTIAVASWIVPERSYPAVDSRRSFLATAGGVLVAGAALATLGRVLGRARIAVEDARAALSLPVRDRPAPVDTSLGVEGISPWKTANDEFYRIDTTLAPPLITPADWSLRIHGLVDREVVLTYDDLLAEDLHEAWVTLCCVSNEVGGDLISNTVWSGVLIKPLLERAGVREGADALLSTSQDGWTAGTPLSALTDGRDAMLAIAMGGEPLPVEHGFPVRMVVPGLYGYVSATKWVVDWEVTRFEDFSAYWTDRGWSPQGPVKTESRIDVPGAGSDLDAGLVEVGGVAWAQHRGIRRVEVSVDDGDWVEADLADVPSTDTWVQWAWAWDATPGDHVLRVRATDATGEVQTSEEVGTVPDGATGWDSVSVSVS